MPAKVKGGYRCPRCNRTKRRTAFYKNVTRTHALSAFCASCMAKAEKARRDRRREDREK